MAKYINRKQLINASDEDILEFYSETIFHGVFSTEIKSIKNASYYKGNISNITLDGNFTNLCPAFLNVPTNSDDIPEGPCAFKCRINIEALRGEDHKYIITLLGRSLRASHHEVTVVKPQDTTEQDLFERWGVEDCQFIGYYHYDEEADTNVIDDIRKPNFDHIPFYPNDKEEKPIKLSFPFDLHRLKKDEYYLFHWKLSKRNKFNPYEIILDLDAHQPQKIDPKWFIDTLFDDRHNDNSKNFGSATNFLDTLSKQLSAKESTFVYELLQNANDYPVDGKMVDVEFNITENYLLFMHTGDKFNVRNISGICGINEKEKVANKKAIGYKGIGFKTVFLNNHYVYLRTGQYSFRFDEKATKIKRLKAPWPILPVWTDYSELSPEINEAFNSSSKDFRVQIALRPDDNRLLHVGKNCYENLFKEVFADSNIILFIPNINSVKVVIDGKEISLCQRNNEEWVVNDYEKDIDYDLQALINKTIDTGRSRIPEKYKDFDATRVSFACKHEGAIIKPIEDAILYCYLPTKASWGFPFLMNSDMIPKGDRNDIETEVLLLDDETNFNEELTSIAGERLFYWLLDLLTSRKYELGSVFSLVPNFDKCIKEHREYKDYILKFKNSFEKVLDKENIIPVKKGIANINYIVYDTIGLTTSGIMTDEEFLEFADLEEVFLPLPILRSNKSFNRFLKNYAKKDLAFTIEDLHDMIENESFQEWLKVQDNNNQFLKFLLENDLLDEFMNEKIFIEDECGKLYCSGDLYYDVDEHLVDLKAFTKHIYYLSLKTRKYFQNNEKWNTFIENHFASFAPKKFIIDTLLSANNKNETIEELKKEESSLHFYYFLAKNDIIDDVIKGLPFISTSNEVISDFKKKFVFSASTIGENLSKSKWLTNISITFISTKYDTIVQEYFKANLGVLTYSNEIIAKDMILSDAYCNKIQEAISEDYTISEDFVKFCFNNESLFTAGALNKYALNVADKEGNYCFIIPKDDKVFMPSSLYDTYCAKEWLNNGWMYSLDNEYIQKCSNGKIAEFKKFMDSAFWVREISAKDFYKFVVRNHIKDIDNNISGGNDANGSKNINFIKYLDENYKLIFEEENDSDIFNGIKLLSNDISDLEVDDNVYVYNQELADIIDKSWFPDNVIYLCNKEYGNSKALIAIGCNTFTFGTFFDNVIVEKLNAINDHINTKEDSIDFHNFIIEHLGELTTNQQVKMSGSKVYLYGKDEAVNNASGHKILSAKAKELFEMGLVEFADLDLIDPEYKTEQNSEYWETRLENTKFTITHFYNWLKDHTDTFRDTLQDVDSNINFWRWLKNNVNDKQLENIPILPIALKNGSINNDSAAIYFSDEYLGGSTIEQSVLKFDENALFISPAYINKDENVEEWKDFWIKLGIKYEIVDILIGTIIPNLADIEDEGLPKLIADNREALEQKYEEDDLISHLTTLRVKGRDGKFYCIYETVYIDCEKEEPFLYIELPNQILFKTREERELIKDIINEVESDFVETLSDWQQRKLERYLEMQDDDCESVRAFHYQFINELSAIRNTGKDSLKEIEGIENIYILNKNDEFCDPSTLTMGSVYKPFFDFEGCGIDSLEYVNDSYIEECAEYPGRLFRALKVHCDIQQDDLKFLESRECALYFWSKYLTKKEANISRIKDFLEGSLLDDITCIPTKDYMKKPSELYYGSEVSRYVKAIEDWENKIPLKDLPEITFSDEYVIFNKLPFKDSLNFLDSLYALVNITGQDRRTQLLQWMIEDYDSSYDENVNDYREDENAVWYNNNNKPLHIKQLYALDYSEKTLDQYFGTNPRIINRAYFPAGDSFKEACDILQIQTITLDDLDMQPVDKMIYTARDINHRLYALAFAALIEPDNWKELYSSYTERLAAVVFYKCKSILIRYTEDEEINQALKKFYHKPNTKDFYFVKDLDDKLVYESYVKEFTKYLNIDEDDIPFDLAKIIMDSRESALENIKEQNSLMLDEAFKDAMDKLIPGIKRELLGNEADKDNEDEIGNNRPSFTTQENNKEKDDLDNDSEDLSETDELNGIEENDEIDSKDDNRSHTDSHQRTPRGLSNYNPREATEEKPYTDMEGWRDLRNNYTPSAPKPFSPDDVRNFGSHGITRTLDVLEPTTSEIDEINSILGEDLSSEQVADQNYLAQLRLYNNLVKRGMTPDESKNDFVRNAHMKNEHTIGGGKYIHKCSAAGGIMYLSPAIWNKIADEHCVVCVYLGAKSNEFMYFNSIDDILKWIDEDDIVIKLTGEEKANVVEELYSGVLRGVKGTAYTLVRINSNEKYNSLFAQLPSNEINNTEENEDEYE